MIPLQRSCCNPITFSAVLFPTPTVSSMSLFHNHVFFSEVSSSDLSFVLSKCYPGISCCVFWYSLSAIVSHTASPLTVTNTSPENMFYNHYSTFRTNYSKNNSTKYRLQRKMPFHHITWQNDIFLFVYISVYFPAVSALFLHYNLLTLSSKQQFHLFHCSFIYKIFQAQMVQTHIFIPVRQLDL